MSELASALHRAVAALLPVAEGLTEASRTLPVRAVTARGTFTPDEEARLLDWFAAVLTVRAAVEEVVVDAVAVLGTSFDRELGRDEWRVFLAGYAAVSILVGLDRTVVEEVARTSLVQRKLNEGSPERGLPRKRLTAVYRALSRPGPALRLLRAMRWLDERRDVLAELAEDPIAGMLVARLPELERALDPSLRRFFDLFGGFESHSWRRRGASARQQTLLATLEAAGRVASELRLPRAKAVLPILEELRPRLRPGDVLVTRHEGALTNVFLPGFWPHVALYVGSPSQRDALGLKLQRSTGEHVDAEETLEALKDGVRFRLLASTLAVDAVAVLRPALPSEEVARALSRVAVHEGKLYDFDFDFFRSDRLVCTEVVYRAYDGIGPLRFSLAERAGRPTLSAEDLVDLALDERPSPFEVVAVYGVGASTRTVCYGSDAASVLTALRQG